VYAAAFGLSMLSVLFNPVAASVLSGVVDDDEIVAANSAIWSAGSGRICSGASSTSCWPRRGHSVVRCSSAPDLQTAGEPPEPAAPV
jgi:hypothetical protein